MSELPGQSGHALPVLQPPVCVPEAEAVLTTDSARRLHRRKSRVYRKWLSFEPSAICARPGASGAPDGRVPQLHVLAGGSLNILSLVSLHQGDERSGRG